MKNPENVSPQAAEIKNPGFQIPPGAAPLCLIFTVREGEQEKIGIIINEQTDPLQVKFALDNAVKIADDRLKQFTSAGQMAGMPQQQQRHPKLTELLWE